MIDTRGDALSQNTCRDRLSSSHRGFLACTESGLPAVLPVALEVDRGQLLVVSAGRDLGGQVVALSVGRHGFRYCRGWTVIARGRLGPEVDGAYALEIATLDGTTFINPRPRRTP